MAGKLPETFKYKLQVLTRDKTDKDKANFEAIVSDLKGDKEAIKVGTLLKDKQVGDFVAGWSAALAAADGVTTAEISNGLSDVLAVKSETQLKAAKGAGQCAALLFKKGLIEKLLDVVDSEEQVKMNDIAEGMEKVRLL